MIAILDYGMGNIGSLVSMLEYIGAEAKVVSDLEGVKRADRFILPGVGAFDEGMRNLAARDFVPAVRDRVFRTGAPILGICLGSQLMTLGSDEGVAHGLGWIPAAVKRFTHELRIPHMGWNEVSPVGDSKLLRGVESPMRFYFAHSYHFVCNDRSLVSAETDYGYLFPSVIQCGNIYGVQFHPERSHRFGMQLLQNFQVC